MEPTADRPPLELFDQPSPDAVGELQDTRTLIELIEEQNAGNEAARAELLALAKELEELQVTALKKSGADSQAQNESQLQQRIDDVLRKRKEFVHRIETTRESAQALFSSQKPRNVVFEQDTKKRPEPEQEADVPEQKSLATIGDIFPSIENPASDYHIHNGGRTHKMSSEDETRSENFQHRAELRVDCERILRNIANVSELRRRLVDAKRRFISTETQVDKMEKRTGAMGSMRKWFSKKLPWGIAKNVPGKKAESATVQGEIADLLRDLRATGISNATNTDATLDPNDIEKAKETIEVNVRETLDELYDERMLHGEDGEPELLVPREKQSVLVSVTYESGSVCRYAVSIHLPKDRYNTDFSQVVHLGFSNPEEFDIIHRLFDDISLTESTFAKIANHPTMRYLTQKGQDIEDEPMPMALEEVDIKGQKLYRIPQVLFERLAPFIVN